jgi:hypothetical protein
MDRGVATWTFRVRVRVRVRVGGRFRVWVRVIVRSESQRDLPLRC